MVRVAALWLNKLRSALRNRFYSVPFLSPLPGVIPSQPGALTGSSTPTAPGPSQRGSACLLPYFFFFLFTPPVVAAPFLLLEPLLPGVLFLVLALLSIVKFGSSWRQGAMGGRSSNSTALLLACTARPSWQLHSGLPCPREESGRERLSCRGCAYMAVEWHRPPEGVPPRGSGARSRISTTSSSVRP